MSNIMLEINFYDSKQVSTNNLVSMYISFIHVRFLSFTTKYFGSMCLYKFTNHFENTTYAGLKHKIQIKKYCCIKMRKTLHCIASYVVSHLEFLSTVSFIITFLCGGNRFYCFEPLYKLLFIAL